MSESLPGRLKAAREGKGVVHAAPHAPVEAVEGRKIWVACFGILVGLFGMLCCAGVYRWYVGDRISQTGPGGPIFIAAMATFAGALLNASRKKFLAGVCLGVAVGSLIFVGMMCLGVFSGWHGS